MHLSLETLKKDKDFKAVYGKGKSIANRQLVLYSKPNGLPNNRYGFSISKKIGNAVTRNLFRRRLKDILRNTKNIQSGYDMIFIVRMGARDVDFSTLKKSLIHILKKSGKLQ